MKNADFIKNICEECLVEGEKVLSTKWVARYLGSMEIMNPTTYVNNGSFKEWEFNCRVLINLLGDHANPWKEFFLKEKINDLSSVNSMIGGLKSIKHSIGKGYANILSQIK